MSRLEQITKREDLTAALTQLKRRPLIGHEIHVGEVHETPEYDEKRIIGTIDHRKN